MNISGQRKAVWLICILLWLCAAAGIAGDALEDGFRKPPDAARPHTWWHWVNGNVSREGITADLEAMRRAGIGGAQIFHVDCGLPAGPVPYMSPKWRDLVRHAAKEANRLGIELCLHNCAGWSSSGGPWITPDHAMQVLVWTETKARGPARFSGSLPQPATRLDYYRDIAVLAFRMPEAESRGEGFRIRDIAVKAAFDRADRLQPDTSPTPPGAAIRSSGILDLTGRMDASGRLEWDVPEGDWVIFRIGHTPTGKDNHPAPPEGRGLECDKLSRDAMDVHWAGIMAKVLSDLGPLAGKTLNNALIDSYEVGCQNWTPKFREEFLRRRSYDLLPFLPVITGRVVDSLEISERFLWDFRRTIADLYAENYFGYFGELCRKHGLKFSVEPYGNGLFDNLQSGGLADIPMGEFWVGGGAGDTPKLAASAAHTNGRRIVGAESFTADEQRGRWLVDPSSIKALGDMVFCQGVNRYIFHRYAHQPWQNLLPGLTMGPWGMHLERTVTWWDQGAAWLRYVARAQHLLQSGRFVADACYFYGEDAPNDLPVSQIRSALPPGYDYDGCDTGAMLRRMSVRQGRIALPDGMSYRVLVLPDSRFMTPRVLKKVRDLVQAGAVVVGPKPSQSPGLTGYPDCDREVKHLAEEVWGDCDGKNVREHTFGKGRVFWGVPLAEVFAKLGVRPDFEYRSEARDASLAYIHRRAGDADFYFVSNQRHRLEEADCTFRVSGKIPELWHPDTGVVEAAPVYREQKGRITIPLRFGPAGSVFVVFRQKARGDHLVSLTRSGPPLPGPSMRIEIQRAVYEAIDGRGGTDVTAKVAELAARGEYAIPASNSLFGDPTPMTVKRLRVDYLLNGKPMQKTVAENETLELVAGWEEAALQAYELAPTPRGGAVLKPWQPGVYTARTTQGRTIRESVREPARSLALSGPWTLRFPPGWGAPERARLDRLISWTEHRDAGVRYFSGTAEYVKEIDIPARMLGAGRELHLDLGRVKHFAEVSLNGRSLGTLWKPPFRVDVTGSVQPGRNLLKIRVTNLWPNRLIGDEQLPGEVEWSGNAIKEWPKWLLEGRPRPKTGRFTFTTWHFYRKDSPLLESGLLGPVILRSVQKVMLR